MDKINSIAFVEAKKRILELTEKMGLNPNVLKYFEEGKVYYSYLTAGGFIGSIDTIAHDSRYEEAVKNFEREYEGNIVFHAIETITEWGEMLSLLYVGNNPDEWEVERLYQNYIAAYTVNFSRPDDSEFGDIIIQGFGKSGALVRVG